MSRHFNPLGSVQDCNQCGLTVDSEIVVCCASCGFDTCPGCMVDSKCSDCDELSRNDESDRVWRED